MDKAEVARLANTLLSDIEHDSLPVELLVAKALTLAKVVADAEMIEWLTYELDRYVSDTPIAAKYLVLTRRWDEPSKIYDSAASISHEITTMLHSLDVEKQLEPSGQFAIDQQREKAKNVNALAQAISRRRLIISDIKARLHLFASRVLVEAQFSDTSRSIFERYQAAVDKELANNATEAFEKLPFVFERLRNGELEAVSHALTSCRRIIDSFVDAIYPPRSGTVIVDGRELDCGVDKTKIRIRAFMANKIASDRRRERINKNLGALYDRLSAGVHGEVTVDEAQALVLNTYLFLGELACLS